MMLRAREGGLQRIVSNSYVQISTNLSHRSNIMRTRMYGVHVLITPSAGRRERRQFLFEFRFRRAKGGEDNDFPMR